MIHLPLPAWERTRKSKEIPAVNHREPLPHSRSRRPEIESPPPAGQHQGRSQEEAVSRSFTPMPPRRSEDSPLRSAKRPLVAPGLHGLELPAAQRVGKTTREARNLSRSPGVRNPRQDTAGPCVVAALASDRVKARDSNPRQPKFSFGALPTELALWLKHDLHAGFESASERSRACHPRRRTARHTSPLLPALLLRAVPVSQDRKTKKPSGDRSPEGSSRRNAVRTIF